MSYSPNPDLPTEIYWSRGSLYTSLTSLKGYMSGRLNQYVRSQTRNRLGSIDYEGVDFSDFNPRRIYKLVRMDGGSVAEWEDITDEVMQNRIAYNKGKK